VIKKPQRWWPGPDLCCDVYGGGGDGDGDDEDDYDKNDADVGGEDDDILQCFSVRVS
jgi:hypothetical protein